MTCTHPDVRTFDSLRCCMSCGFALLGQGDHTENDEGSHPNTSINQATRRWVPRYVFKKLNYELGQEIRLVILQPGRYDEELHGMIIHANLDDHPHFEAVSYTWADQRGVTQMSCRVICRNWHEITISANCDAVLRRIRARGCRTPLWIDMLCIDQENLTERNHQVGLMDAIYRAATTVFVDLGDETESSRVVFDCLKNFDGRTKVLPSTIFNDFLSRRWFHRVWVLQEVSLAKAVIVQCGSRAANWENFRLFFQHQPHAQDGIGDGSTLPAALIMNHCVASYLEIEQLVQLLETIRMVKAMDPRDKIYALLGLCRRELRAQFPVEYTKETSKLYLRVAVLYVLRRDDASILHHVVAGSSIQNLPSWVPDWTLPKTNATMTQQLSLSTAIPDKIPASNVFPDSQARLVQSMVLPRFQPDPIPTLWVRGRCLGAVTFVATRPEKLSVPETLHSTFYQSTSNKNRDNTPPSWEPWWVQRGPGNRIYRGEIPQEKLRQVINEFGDRVEVARRGWDMVEVKVMVSEQERDTSMSKQFWSMLADRLLEPQIGKSYSAFGIPPTFGETTSNILKSPRLQHCIPHNRCGFCQSSYREPLFRIRRPRYSSRYMLDKFAKESQPVAKSRLLFGTDYSLGYGPYSIKLGDSVWILEGHTSIYVLRKDDVHVRHQKRPVQNQPSQYRIIDRCYYYQPTMRLYKCPLCKISLEHGYNHSPPWELINLT